MSTMLRVAFFATNGLYSQTVFDRLLHSPGIDVVALCLAMESAGPSRLSAPFRALQPPVPSADDPMALGLAPSFVERQTLHMAWEAGVPAFAIAQLAAAEPVSLLQSLALDVACVACFPRRIPPNLLAVPGHGFLNIHPSLLPAYRGPAPIFWQLLAGETKTGVTVHWLDADWDSGALAGQRSVAYPEGASGTELDRLLAGAGAELLVEVLAQVAAGAVSRQPQPDGGSYEPWPRPQDFTLSTDWPAQRAFNFMAGCSEWGFPSSVVVDGKTLWLREAQTWQPGTQAEAVAWLSRDDVSVRFTPGVLRARVVDVTDES